MCVCKSFSFFFSFSTGIFENRNSPNKRNLKLEEKKRKEKINKGTLLILPLQPAMEVTFYMFLHHQMIKWAKESFHLQSIQRKKKVKKIEREKKDFLFLLFSLTNFTFFQFSLLHCLSLNCPLEIKKSYTVNSHSLSLT